MIDSLAYELKSGTRKIDQRFKQLEEELQQLIEKQHGTPNTYLAKKLKLLREEFDKQFKQR